MAAGTFTNAGKVLSASQMNGTTSTPPLYIAIGSGVAGDATAVALTTQYSTGTNAVGTTTARATGTNTVINGLDAYAATFQTVGTITAAVAGVNVTEAGLFTAVSGGTMAVIAGFTSVALAIGDSIQITGQIRYT